MTKTQAWRVINKAVRKRMCRVGWHQQPKRLRIWLDGRLLYDGAP